MLRSRPAGNGSLDWRREVADKSGSSPRYEGKAPQTRGFLFVAGGAYLVFGAVVSLLVDTRSMAQRSCDLRPEVSARR